MCFVSVSEREMCCPECCINHSYLVKKPADLTSTFNIRLFISTAQFSGGKMRFQNSQIKFVRNASQPPFENKAVMFHPGDENKDAGLFNLCLSVVRADFHRNLMPDLFYRLCSFIATIKELHRFIMSQADILHEPLHHGDSPALSQFTSQFKFTTSVQMDLIV